MTNLFFRIIRKLRKDIRKIALQRVFYRFRRQTMVPRRRFVENLVLVETALRTPALDGGCIVECGTWRGGMAAALVLVGGKGRDYFFFDSFEGLPPAKENDGERAIAWQADKTAADYYDNCAASLEEFLDLITTVSPAGDNIHTIKGFFDATLPDFAPPPIAVLRLDGDWYDSTMICLETLWPHVLDGGLVIIDDYYYWDGCTRAVHDFLSRHDLPERIRQSPAGTYYIIRGSRG